MLPKIGMGTFGSDRYGAEAVAKAVADAIEIGYRLFDCASVYGNESEIGKVFRKAFRNGTLKREETTVVSKVWNDAHGKGRVAESCFRSLKELGLGYLDIYFLHWPFPNAHGEACGADSRDPDSRPFFAEEFLETWRQLEALKKQGYVKEIAMSNMTTAKFEAVLPQCEIAPYAHEMELHPTFPQDELFEYCKNKGMAVIGYCPLGSPNRPERDRTPEDAADTEIPAILEIAEAHNCHPAEICLAWAIRRGQIPIPFSSRKENLYKNFTVAETVKLTDGEMERLKGLSSGNRLVKGHVFLWNGARDWRELWDEDGKLASWSFNNGQWKKI